MHVSYRPIDWIPGIPGHLYRVGDDGMIWRWYRGGKGKHGLLPPRWKPLKPVRNQNGQSQVMLTAGETRKVFQVGHLVLRAFVGPRSPGLIAFHYPDRNPSNNRLDNLRYAPSGTQLFEYGGHPATLVLYAKGEDHPNAEFSEEEVRTVFRLHHEEGLGPTVIARRMLVSGSCIEGILARRTWAHIDPPPGFSYRRNYRPSAILSEEDVRSILALKGKGITLTEIGRRFGVSRSAISKIMNGHHWRHVPRTLPALAP